MSSFHPITGVQLTALEIERKALNEEEAITAYVLRLQGEKFSHIAHALGTNTFRLGEVFRGEKHPSARLAAQKALSKETSPRTS